MIQIADNSTVEKSAAALPMGPTALEQNLRSSPYWSLRQLVCQVDRDRVTLRGTVPSFYLKQVAQTLALKAVGVGHVQSDIDVQDS
jgi:hypothetical protein